VSVPTERLRRGDFAGTAAVIHDPLTGNADGSGRTPFAGNVIPANRIDPIARKIVDAWLLGKMPEAEPPATPAVPATKPGADFGNVVAGTTAGMTTASGEVAR